ncbi:MAG: CopD family protein [Geodermatophilaceae bacterium]|nr:CopD family protein [Geodermatophilaceae bacterium]
MSRAGRARTEPDRASPALVATTLVVGAILLLVLLLAAFGGAPEPTVPGLPGAGLFVGWLLPITRLLLDFAAVGAVGCLLFAAYLVPPRDQDLRRPAQRALRAASWCALVWAGLAAVGSLLTLADIAGQSLGEVLTAPGFADSLVSLDQSRSLLLVSALALLVTLSARRVKTTDGPMLVLVLALAALVPPILTGHAATHRAHELATVSLVIHVIAVSLWVGGLAALLMFRRRSPGKDAATVSRYSTVALVCFGLTAASGLLNAVIRLGDGTGLFAELLGSGYGVLILVKLAALAALAWFGWWHRRHAIALLAAGRPSAFRRFAGREVVLMLATIAVAVALSRTPTPSGGSSDVVDPADPGHQHAASTAFTGPPTSGH